MAKTCSPTAGRGACVISGDRPTRRSSGQEHIAVFILREISGRVPWLPIVAARARLSRKRREEPPSTPQRTTSLGTTLCFDSCFPFSASPTPNPSIFAPHAAMCTNFGAGEPVVSMGGTHVFGVTRPNERPAHTHRAPLPKIASADQYGIGQRHRRRRDDESGHRGGQLPGLFAGTS